jgi:hypothetical protein
MNIRTVQRLIVITTMLAPLIQKADPDPINGDNPQDTCSEVAFFEVTNVWNKVTQPADQKFHETFDAISDATPEKPVVIVRKVADGKYVIDKMDDGIGPIIAGTMPQWYALSWYDRACGRLTTQYQQMRLRKGLNSTTPILNINFNTKYEKDRTGVLKIAQDDKNVEIVPFETRDTYASSEERLLEMIGRLRKRTKGTIGYFNCKAGKGRSISGNAAYGFYVLEHAEIRDTEGNILQQANAKTSFFSIEDSWHMLNDRLMYKRPVANINGKQKPVLFSSFKKIREAKKPTATAATISTTTVIPTSSTPTLLPPLTVTPFPTTTITAIAPVPNPAPAPTTPTATTPTISITGNPAPQAPVIPQTTTPPQPAISAPVPVPVPTTTSVSTSTTPVLNPPTPTISDNNKPQQQRFFLLRWVSNLFARNTQKDTVEQPITKPTNHRGIFGWFWHWLGY